MLWVDKYSPRNISGLTYHEAITPRLRAIAKTPDFPHLLFTGPAGSGKRTRVNALLMEVFSANSLAPPKLTLEHKSVAVSDTKSVDVTTLCSPHHVEINLSELGNNDRGVVMTMIKELAQSTPIQTSGSKARPFKVLVLHEVDRMTRPAQQALRRTMEKYISTCRLVLVAESTGRLIAPLRSRCLEIRVPSPSDDVLLATMKNVLEQEGENTTQLTEALSNTILQYSQGNVRRALLLLEAAWRNERTFAPPEWQVAIVDIASAITKEQSPKKLYEVRNKFYDLLSACIPADLILRHVVLELIPQVDAQAQQEFAQCAALYDHSMRMGTKPIFHLEAFAARAMSVYKSFMSRIG
eukprot:PhM_4_TR5390/c0_g1_i1/m.60284/K10756/RFC3_5; replication factor C subunit 3/5